MTQNQETDSAATTVRVPPDLAQELDGIIKEYGYEMLSTAARNAMRVGCKLFQTDPDAYKLLLNGNA